MARFSASIRRTRRGDFQLRLTPEGRTLLRSLPGQLRELLSSDDPALERLFPPAYPDDPLRNEEYAEMVRGDLLAGRLAAVEVMEATIDAERLDEEQLTAWLSALNDLRLVLGSRLEITEDLYDEGLPETDARRPAFTVYLYLGLLEEHAVEALASGIDPRGVS